MQLVGVVGRISIFSGVKVQEASCGRPEQDKVTNMGAVRDELFTGVIVTFSDPAWPAFRVNGRVPGEIAAAPMVKFGVPPEVFGTTCVPADIEA